MNVLDFVNKLFLLYPNSWTNDNEMLKRKQYMTALEEKKIDFEMLLERIALHHTDNFMPLTAWLLDQARFCYPKGMVNRFLNVKIYNPVYKCEMVDAFETSKMLTDEEIIADYKKIFPNHQEGWKVIDVYWE